MRLSLVLPLILLPLAARAGELPASVDAAQIPAYRVLENGVAAAGQPSPAALHSLKEMGFRTVVNLRTEAEGASAENEPVTAQGLRYVSVPVTAESLSLADVERVEKVLADQASRPVLLHCASSNRVGAVWAVIQARKGMDLEKALAAGRGAGMHSPVMEAAVRRVLETAEIPKGPAPTAPLKP